MHLLATLATKFRSYRRVYGWVLADLLQRQWGHAVLVVALAATGVAARFASVGAVILFVHAQEESQPVRVLGMQFPATTQPRDLALWAAAVLVLAALTAVASYLAEARIFACARRYAQSAIDRELDIIAQREGWRLPRALGEDETAAVRRLISRDAVMLLRGVLILLRSIVPLITLIFAAGVLLAIQLPLTLIVLGAFALYLVPFYLLNLRVVSSSRQREQHTKALSVELRRVLPFLLGRSIATAGMADHPTSRFDHAVRAALPFARTWSSLRSILLARKRVTLLQDVFFGLVLVASLVVFAIFVADGARSWALFLSYLIALRFASAGMSSFAAMLTTTNRFLPQVRRTVEFIRANDRRGRELNEDAAVGHPAVAAGGTPNHCHILQLAPAADRATIEGSAAELALAPGMRVWCVETEPPTARTLRRWCRSLCNGAGPGDAMWLRCSLLRWIERVPVIAGASTTHVSASDPVKPAGRLTDRGADRLRTLLAPALLAENNVIVLDARLLAADTNADERSDLLVELRSHGVILLGSQRELAAVSGDVVDAVLIADAGRVRGIGVPSWFADAAAANRELAEKSARGRAGRDKLECTLNEEGDDEDND